MQSYRRSLPGLLFLFLAEIMGPVQAEPSPQDRSPNSGSGARYTFCFADELRVEFGRITFGAESPSFAGRSHGVRGRICGIYPEANGFVAYGLGRTSCDERRPQVWRARTQDGFTFEDQELLFEIPSRDRRVHWAAGDLARNNKTLLLLQSEIGHPPTMGHPFHAYRGALDGGPWDQLNEDPVYRGQDAFGLVWNPGLNLFVNYQTSYQAWDKKYPDNMGYVRRVLHIRTSPDGLRWTPGDSFGVGARHLPDHLLIVPDEHDLPGSEFYKFSAIKLDGFWAGTMVVYASQPPHLLPAGRSHGPFLACEWWVSRDGINWERPFRNRSGLEGVPYQFSYYLYPPVVAGDELRWSIFNRHEVREHAGQNVYTLDRRRMFYAYSRAPAEIVTPVLALSGRPLELDMSFDAIRRNEQGMLRQGYLMAELLDESGNVIPGFERERCLFAPAVSGKGPDRITLQWGPNHLPADAAGMSVRLRLCFRDARLYSLLH